jgi:hypothetical protein
MPIWARWFKARFVFQLMLKIDTAAALWSLQEASERAAVRHAGVAYAMPRVPSDHGGPGRTLKPFVLCCCRKLPDALPCARLALCAGDFSSAPLGGGRAITSFFAAPAPAAAATAAGAAQEAGAALYCSGLRPGHGADKGAADAGTEADAETETGAGVETEAEGRGDGGKRRRTSAGGAAAAGHSLEAPSSSPAAAPRGEERLCANRRMHATGEEQHQHQQQNSGQWPGEEEPVASASHGQHKAADPLRVGDSQQMCSLDMALLDGVDLAEQQQQHRRQQQQQRQRQQQGQQHQEHEQRQQQQTCALDTADTALLDGVDLAEQRRILHDIEICKLLQRGRPAGGAADSASCSGRGRGQRAGDRGGRGGAAGSIGGRGRAGRGSEGRGTRRQLSIATMFGRPQ